MRLIIISNRLPVKVQRDGDIYSFSKSEGGVATGLDSLDVEMEKIWIGWPGVDVKYRDEQKMVQDRLAELNSHPVFLSKKQIREYYEGYCNSKIWPLCHYFYTYVKHENNHWRAYKEVNELFMKKACEVIEDNDIVWVQDYQLMLLPGMLRKCGKKVSIGYFHHIPFPSYELFRILPERQEILEGLLGADLIGFHTHDYMRHFISAAERVLDQSFELDELWYQNRYITVDFFPMGINFEMYHNAIKNPIVKNLVSQNRKMTEGQKMILSVDRLDYSKGILNRLEGFAIFLRDNPEYHGRVSLYMIIVPSRDSVGDYAELKRRVDQMIGSINGQFSKLDWTPVKYFYHSLSFEELAATYYMADIALVTPLRDGMNLVAKEYVAAKNSNPGVLILSEMAGASIELMDAVIMNPNDPAQISESIIKALKMPIKEQNTRIKRMQKILKHQSVGRWASRFIEELIDTKNKNNSLGKKLITPEIIKKVGEEYNSTNKRLFILDYDGTLSPFYSRPEEAAPSSEIIELLKVLSQDPKNRVIISSGRDHKTLESWFGKLNIGLAAEHGAFYKEDGIWHENIVDNIWDNEILGIFKRITEKTPRSSLEIKQTALVWHYRNVDRWLASIRSQQLTERLLTPCSARGLNIMKGNKIIEVKHIKYTKGSEVKRLLQNSNYDFIFCIGDDTTDEDMFNALPKGSITVKVGGVSQAAKFNIESQSMVIPFIYGFINLETSSSLAKSLTVLINAK